MNTIFKTIISLSLILLIAIVGWFSFTYLNLQKQNSENLARFQCAQSVRYEVKTTTTTISYPPDDLYKKCLKEKGL
jgi:hypothetical protein